MSHDGLVCSQGSDCSDATQVIPEQQQEAPPSSFVVVVSGLCASATAKDLLSLFSMGPRSRALTLKLRPQTSDEKTTHTQSAEVTYGRQEHADTTIARLHQQLTWMGNLRARHASQVIGVKRAQPELPPQSPQSAGLVQANSHLMEDDDQESSSNYNGENAAVNRLCSPQAHARHASAPAAAAAAAAAASSASPPAPSWSAPPMTPVGFRPSLTDSTTSTPLSPPSSSSSSSAWSSSSPSSFGTPYSHKSGYQTPAHAQTSSHCGASGGMARLAVDNEDEEKEQEEAQPAKRHRVTPKQSSADGPAASAGAPGARPSPAQKKKKQPATPRPAAKTPKTTKTATNTPKSSNKKQTQAQLAAQAHSPAPATAAAAAASSIKSPSAARSRGAATPSRTPSLTASKSTPSGVKKTPSVKRTPSSSSRKAASSAAAAAASPAAKPAARAPSTLGPRLLVRPDDPEPVFPLLHRVMTARSSPLRKWVLRLFIDCFKHSYPNDAELQVIATHTGKAVGKVTTAFNNMRSRYQTEIQQAIFSGKLVLSDRASDKHSLTRPWHAPMAGPDYESPHSGKKGETTDAAKKLFEQLQKQWKIQVTWTDAEREYESKWAEEQRNKPPAEQSKKSKTKKKKSKKVKKQAAASPEDDDDVDDIDHEDHDPDGDGDGEGEPQMEDDDDEEEPAQQAPSAAASSSSAAAAGASSSAAGAGSGLHHSLSQPTSLRTIKPRAIGFGSSLSHVVARPAAPIADLSAAAALRAAAARSPVSPMDSAFVSPPSARQQPSAFSSGMSIFQLPAAASAASAAAAAAAGPCPSPPAVASPIAFSNWPPAYLFPGGPGHALAAFPFAQPQMPLHEAFSAAQERAAAAAAPLCAPAPSSTPASRL